MRGGPRRLVAATLMASSLAFAVGGFAWAQQATFGPAGTVAAAPGWRGRYVAGIEMLDANPLWLHDANEALTSLHASTVYLYVAYHGQAYFPLPRAAAGYGLVTAADVLGQAITDLRQERFRVVLVVSSALLDPTTAPPAGRAMLQPGSGVIDPERALPLVVPVVRALAAYRPYAIYVGEPFDWPGDPPVPVSAWLRFYAALRQAAGRVRLTMLLPTVHDEYQPVALSYDAPLYTALARSGLFAAVGVDAEGMVPRPGPGAAVTDRWLATAPDQFAAAAARLGGSNALYEIPLTNPYALGQPAPLSLVTQAVRAAQAYDVKGVVVFADEYLGTYSAADQVAIGRALAGFIAGPDRGLAPRAGLRRATAARRRAAPASGPLTVVP